VIHAIPAQRVRICILDTGYDAESVFFQYPVRRQRLVKWKDWVEESQECKDTHGHGTHIVSLIMKIAPHADICVARVAKDTASLSDSSENIAKVSHINPSPSSISNTCLGHRVG
jgi:subtilisin family serine protease